MMVYICISCSACEVQRCYMVSGCLPHACITRVQAQVWSALQHYKHVPGLHHLITSTCLVFQSCACNSSSLELQAYVWSAALQLQAYVWSAALEYEHMSGLHYYEYAHMSDLQAADTVKQQAVQLASSKSQAASALAAQKAAEQVKLKCRNAKCLVFCVEQESCHKFYTKN